MKVLCVSVTARGRALAARLPWERVHGGAAETIRRRWSEVDGLVLFLATGAAVRIIAPLLTDKATDPAVVCVDEAGRFAVSLCGGHAAGGNELAGAVASFLGAQPVVTTATDAIGLTGLDQVPGFGISGSSQAVAAVTAALLDGRPVAIENRRNWPVPWRGDPSGVLRVAVSDEVVTGPAGGLAAGMVVLHPPSLVAGIGLSTGSPLDEVPRLLEATLESAGLARSSVSEVATIDRKAREPAIAALGLPVRSFSPVQLAGIDVPTPSAVVDRAVGTPSVCEAAALLAAGPGGELVVTKRTTATATIAIARRAQPRGRVSLIGLGPGAREHRTPAAKRAIREADVVIGYRAYLDQCRDLLREGQERIASPIGDEVVRAKQAVAEAAAGRRVAVVSSGDAGVYGMASVTLELCGSSDIDVEVVPGVTAATAAAASLGAPLGHDHAAISLSDLLTPWAVIEHRLRAAAEAGLVVTLYNPRSAGRPWQLGAARDIFLEHRAASPPVGVVTAATRVDEQVWLTTLGELDPKLAGMTTCVVIGAETTRIVAGRMVTPRGFGA